MRKIHIRLPGNTTESYCDANVFNNFKTNWLPAGAKDRFIYNASILKTCINSELVEQTLTMEQSSIDKTIPDVFGNRCCIPLDTETLTSRHLFYPSCLKQPLTFELTFDDQDNVFECSVLPLQT